MIDPRKLFEIISGEYQKTSQPLKERASVLPLGQYEDGSVGLAWPGLLAAPAEGVANFGSQGFGEEAVPYNSRMAFDAAGGAMTGGLGLGLAGGMADNAVGSAGGRLSPNVSKNLAGRDVYDFGNGTQVTLKDWPSGGRMIDNVLTDPQARGQGQARQAMEYITREADQAGTPLKLSVAPGDTSIDPQRLQSFYQSLGFEDLGGSYMKRDPRAADLPMDLASRMARAKEMGFDTEKTWYHGSTHDFLEFDPTRGNPEGHLGSGDGTSNYVVFDDALIDILRKYANAPTGAMVPAGMEASQDGEIDTAAILAALEQSQHLVNSYRF